MTRIGSLLKSKRLESGETALIFAGRFFRSTPTISRRSFYYQIENGSRKCPKKHLESAAEILGIGVSDVKLLNKKTTLKRRDINDEQFTGDDLRQLACVAEVLGKPLSIATMLQILSELREPPSV